MRRMPTMFGGLPSSRESLMRYGDQQGQVPYGQQFPQQQQAQGQPFQAQGGPFIAGLDDVHARRYGGPLRFSGPGQQQQPQQQPQQQSFGAGMFQFGSPYQAYQQGPMQQGPMQQPGGLPPYAAYGQQQAQRQPQTTWLNSPLNPNRR